MNSRRFTCYLIKIDGKKSGLARQRELVAALQTRSSAGMAQRRLSAPCFRGLKSLSTVPHHPAMLVICCGMARERQDRHSSCLTYRAKAGVEKPTAENA